ncbi:MAG: tetratricopeptide repeat protein [Candidatus Thermoplasmatota archaeon]|nr:tetratricopeptide repeat protein [Candidatus Thermoplasmatota archaeon]
MARLALSPNERLLLHLMEMDRFRDDVEVPLGASQEGIAQRLQVQVHNVSRALSSLESEVLVFDRLTHIRGAPKRRRAYFLTEKGRVAAQSIRSDVLRRPVVVESDGRAQEMSLEEALRRVSGKTGITPSLLDAVDIASRNELIAAEAFAAVPRHGPKQEFPVLQQGRPKVEAFFGRESEVSTITEALAGDPASTVLIWGLPGIGKSTLGSRLFEDLAGRRPLLWFTFRDWDTEASFLAVLTEFLVSAGRAKTSAAFKRGAGTGEFFSPMVADLSGLGAVLFIDDAHKSEGRCSTIMSMIVEAVDASRSSKAVLMSRSVPSFFSKSAEGHLSHELTGLDRDSAWKLVQSLNVKDGVRVVNESHGHPLLLRMLARAGASEAAGDVMSFVEREVNSSLAGDERKLLELISVFRHPISLNAIEGIDTGSAAGLRERALIIDQEGGVTTHDLLRDFFSSHLRAEDRKVLHRKAAEYCGTRPGVEWKLEALYHRVEAGDWAGAAQTTLSSASELSKEFPEETLALITGMLPGDMSASDRAELLFIRGQLQETLGRPEAAMADYDESSALLGDGDPSKKAIVLEALARLHSQINRLAESLSVHRDALKLYERSGDTEGQIREWLSMGGVFRRKGDQAKAREAYTQALTIASKQEDRAAQAACLNNLALLDWDEGRHRDAEVRLKDSVRLAHVIKDHLGEAKGLENLARLSEVQNRLDEVPNIYLESSEAFRRAGEIVEFKRLQAASAEALGRQRRSEAAIELCTRVLERPEFRKRKGLFQRSPVYDHGDLALASALVEVLRESGDRKRAQKELARFLSMASAVGDQDQVAKGKLLASMISEDSGELEAAVKGLEEAEALLRGTGNHDGLIAVHMRLGLLEEKLGRYEAAERDYQEAARHADLAGDKYAQSLALENLAAVRKG